MSAGAPGFAFLLAHDVRLGARGLTGFLGDRSPRAKYLILAAVAVGLHVVAWPVALWLGAREQGSDGARFLAVAMRSGALFILPWAVASAMTQVTRMLYQRADLDLLFASPLPSRTVLAARALVLAFEGVGSVGALLLPVADAAALQGRPRWLALYPALASAGLFGAGLGLILALTLFFAVGPRRARIVAQIAATFVGAAAVLTAQVATMLPAATRARLYDALTPSSGAGDMASALLELPERAAAGDPSAILSWALVALAMFSLAIAGFGERFAEAARLSAGAPTVAGRASGPARFRAHLGAALRVKEHRLLRRDPWLISQMMLQALYTLPIGLMLWRNGGLTGTAGVAFGPTLVVIAGQFAGSLAWLATSAEDAPDFLATAPATRARIERGKLFAIALPVGAVMAAPMLALAYASPWGALCALVCGGAASASSSLLMLWRQAPARRGLVLRRHSQSKLVALIEHWLSMLWALATAAAAFGSLACLFPAALAGVTLWLTRPARPRAPLPS